MKWVRACLASLGLCGVVLVAAEPTVIHVAPVPEGNDANDGSRSAPFATLERARRAVRDYLGGHVQQTDIVVELVAGNYELDRPVRFAPEDSGRQGFDIIYRAVPGAYVVLSGGRRVDGWQRDPDGAYRAAVGAGVDFRQLWVNGRPAVRARTPNAGQYFQLEAEREADGFDLPGDRLAGITVRPGEVEMSVLIAWMHKRLRIARVAAAGKSGQLRAVIEAAEWDGITRQPQGDRVYRGRSYWLENAPEFLDAPGEFYLDRAAGVVRYRPRPGEDMATATVIRPELENLIVLAGRLDAPVQHLRFEGLAFLHTGWTRPNRHGFVDVQANSLVPADLAGAVDPQYRHNQRKDRVPAAFQASTADAIVLRHCRFARLGGTGVMFTHGGNDNLVEGNFFYDLAGGGIEFGEDAVKPAEARLIPRHNRIANNFLAHIGTDYFGSVAILGYYTDGLEITHNELTALPYTAISQGWGWGLPPGPPGARGNRITGNRVTNFMRRLDDGGGIYTTDRQLGSEISGNVLSGMLTTDPQTKAGGALYLDQCTEGFRVSDNVVTQSLRWLYIWNPNIRHNRVERNYADTANQRNDGEDNIVEPVRMLGAEPWPEAARAVEAAAGIEPEFGNTREFDASAEIISESTSLDFQATSGAWETVAVADGYGPVRWRGTGAEPAARWLPLLPRGGLYEVAVWRAAGAPGTLYTVRHAEGETLVVLQPAGADSGWTRLGYYRFRAGAEAELRLSTWLTGENKPLLADAVRFRIMPPDSR